MKPAMVYSRTMTSIEKITPAMGVLNEEPIAAAAPQPIRTRIELLGSFSVWPNRLLTDAPRWMAGPSRPPVWPLISAIAPVTNCTSKFFTER